MDISQEIKDVLKNSQQDWPASTKYSVRQDQSKIIEDTVSDLVNNIISGFILVLAVLLFAMGVRNAFFVAIAIPLSMLVAFCGMLAGGISGNLMSLGAIDFGLIVDGLLQIEFET